MKPTTPSQGPDVPAEQASTTVFAWKLLSYLMMKTGTTELKAGARSFRGKQVFRVSAGDKAAFEADTEEEALTQFLEWVLSQDPPMTAAELEAEGKKAEEQEKEQFKQLLNDLTEGGMSDFGKAVEAERAYRKEQVKGFLRSMGAGPWTINEELTERAATVTGIADLVTVELLDAWREMQP